MNLCLRLAVAISVLLILPSTSTAGVRVTDFGARADGATDDSAAFTRAIAAVARGGIVNVPAGSYVLRHSIALPEGVRLLGEGACWENSATSLLVCHKEGPAIRLGSYCTVKGLAMLYPENLNMQKPDEYPPSIELAGCNASVENVVFDCAWTGISTAPGGANAGQCLFRDVTGFVHHMGIHLSGGMDVDRFEDIHWFVSRYPTTGPAAEAPYYATHRVGFEFGRQDGVIMTNCFMIGGKTFLRQLPFQDMPDSTKKWTISLGYHISNCWVEDVAEGFVFNGHMSIALYATNILVRGGGVGVRVMADCLGYGAVVSGVTVRGFGKPFRGIEYGIKHDIWPHDLRNNLTISDCHVVEGMPALRLMSGAVRANIRGCLLRGAKGQPAVVVEPGVESFLLTTNTLSGAPAIVDRSGAGCAKVIRDNLVEPLAPAKPRTAAQRRARGRSR